MAPGFRQVVKPIVDHTENAALAGATVAAVAAAPLTIPGAIYLGGKDTWNAERAKTEESFKHAREVIGKGDEGSWFLGKVLDAVGVVNATVAVPGQAATYLINDVGTKLYPVYKKALTGISSTDQLVMNISSFRGFRGRRDKFEDVHLWGRGISGFTDQMGGLTGGSSELLLRFSEFGGGSQIYNTFDAELAGIADPAARDKRISELATMWLSQQMSLAIGDKKQFEGIMKKVKDNKNSPEKARYSAILRGVIDRFVDIFLPSPNGIVLLGEPYPTRGIALLAAPIKQEFDSKLSKYRKNNYDSTTDIDLNSMGLGNFTADVNTWVDNTGAPLFPGGINDIRAAYGLENDGVRLVTPAPFDLPVGVFEDTLMPRIMDMFRHQPGFPTRQPMLAIVEQELMHLIYPILLEQADPMQVLRAKFGANTDEGVAYMNKENKDKKKSMVEQGWKPPLLDKQWLVYLPKKAQGAYETLLKRFDDIKPENVVQPGDDLIKKLLAIPLDTGRSVSAASTFNLESSWASIVSDLDTIYNGIRTNMAGLGQQSEAMIVYNHIARSYVLAVMKYISSQKNVPAGLENRLFTWLANGTSLPHPWMRIGNNPPDPVLENEVLTWFETAYPVPAAGSANEAEVKSKRSEIIKMFGIEQKLVERQMNEATRIIADTHRDYMNEVATNIATITPLVTAIDTALAPLAGLPNTDPTVVAAKPGLLAQRAALVAQIQFPVYKAGIDQAKSLIDSIDRASVTDPLLTARFAVTDAALLALTTAYNHYHQRIHAIDLL